MSNVLAVLGRPRGLQVVIGDGVDRDKLRKAMPAAVSPPRAVTGAELATAYASMDVFVHPGEHETFARPYRRRWRPDCRWSLGRRRTYPIW